MTGTMGNYYRESPWANPQGPETGQYHVSRGYYDISQIDLSFRRFGGANGVRRARGQSERGPGSACSAG